MSTVYTLHVTAPGETISVTPIQSESLATLRMIRDALGITGVRILAETTIHTLSVIDECGTCQGCRNDDGCYALDLPEYVAPEHRAREW